MHLLIIWEFGRYQQTKIIQDLKEHLKIIDCYEIEWSPQSVPNNFTRFYGVNLPNKSFKERECGRGKFLLLLLIDEQPHYEHRMTSHGDELVNVKMFDLKSKYRSWTGGGHKIHGTTSQKETNHDLTLLLGINCEDYLKQYGVRNWDGSIQKIQRDITGEHGWDCLVDLFYVLNNTITYVVIRGEENLSNMKLDNHADVDILVKEWQNAIYLMNGQQCWFDSPYRPKVSINTKRDGTFLFDLWMSSLSYHSESWHNNMFATREYTGLYYRLNLENSFYSLIYHCLVHKKKTATDYYPVLKDLFCRIHSDCYVFLKMYKYPMDLYYQVLQRYMDEHGYEYTYAKEDYHCYYREAIPKIKFAWEYLKTVNGFSEILPYNVDSLGSDSGYIYFTGNYKGKKIFIKYGGVEDSCKNEIFFSKKVSDWNGNNFLTPIVYDDNPNHSYIAFDFIEGVSLLAYCQTSSNKEHISGQLLSIIKTLNACHIMHRDIRPDNFIVIDGYVKLIDFQFAIDFDNPIELKCMETHKSILMSLGEEYRYKKYVWCDVCSFQKIADEYGLDVDFPRLFKKIPKVRLPLSRIIYEEVHRLYMRLKFIKNEIRKVIGK